ncbi:MAG: hypothetical protein ACNA8W_26030, partial [Bradymonadaceae bacterium]
RPHWPAPDDAPRIEVRYDNEGFTLALSTQGPPLMKMPLPENLERPRWDMDQSGSASILTLRGRLRGAEFLGTWTMIQGDPQIAFTASLTNLAPAELEHVIALPMQFQAESVRVMDGSLRRRAAPLDTEASSLHWIGMELLEAHLIISSPRAANLRMTRYSERTEVELILWAGPDSHWPRGCGEETPGIDLHARQIITVGDAPAFALSPLSSGFEAALVPLFTEPLTAELRPGAARDTEDWMARTRTLLYGHSTPEDPRYGNGGLLGSNFGGVVALPVPIWEVPEVQEWADSLSLSRVDLVPQNSPPFAPYPRPAVAAEERCPAALEAVQHNRPALFVGPETTRTADLAAHPFTPGYPLLVEAARLDGRRASLVDGVLSRDQLQRWTEDRGILFLSTPLIATRNPLAGVAAQTLLEPESEGNWTL